MAWMSAMGHCCNCGALFSFNPERVPSIRGRYVEGRFQIDPTGNREPVCRPCMERGNALRVAQGKEPFPIPSGAYEAEEVA